MPSLRFKAHTLFQARTLFVTAQHLRRGRRLPVELEAEYLAMLATYVNNPPEPQPRHRLLQAQPQMQLPHPAPVPQPQAAALPNELQLQPLGITLSRAPIVYV